MTSVLINQLTTPLIFTVFALGFSIIWYFYRRFESAALFALSYMSGAIAFGLETVIVTPDPFNHWAFAGDIFYVLTATFFTLAIYARYDQRALYEFIIPLAMVMAFAVYWYRYVDHDVVLRSQAVSYGCGIMLLLALPGIKPAYQAPIDRILFWLLAFFGGQFFVTAYLTLNINAEQLTVANFSTSTFLAAINFIVSALSLSLAMTLFVQYGMDIIQVLQGETQTDALSGLLNRRGFENRAKSLLTDPDNTATEFILIVCDLDNFKSINDQYGHEIGDRVIQGFANLLRKNTRQSDIAGRVGGEEFCILLPDANSDQAKEIAERCRLEFSKMIIDGLPADHSISASFGIALWREQDDYQKLFRRADQGLYIAKNNGKNRIVPA